MYYVYILKSGYDGSLYKGYTKDLAQRIHDHNRGKSRYSSRKCPWELVYYEEFVTREQALKRERYLKSAAGRRFIRELRLSEVVRVPRPTE
jgi:putative endonuclease